jgi:hypothetical protein
MLCLWLWIPGSLATLGPRNDNEESRMNVKGPP